MAKLELDLNNDDVTFNVSDVEPTDVVLKTVKTKVALETLVRRPIEAASDYSDDCLENVTNNPLISAAKTAFALHLPLVFTPDVIWTTLCQGLSIHIDMNWDAFEARCLQPGVAPNRLFRVPLEDLPYGSPEAAWGQLIEDVAGTARSGIEEELSELFELTFSTSTVASRLAQDIAFLSAVNKSFTLYPEAYVCGIPTVTLRGDLNDWKLIREMAEKFAAFGLDWWVDELVLILDQFVAAAQNEIDLEFWGALFADPDDENGVCANPEFVSGWIGKLFPYLSFGCSDHRENSLLLNGEPPYLASFPSGLRQFSMRAQHGSVARIVGGLIGVRVDTESGTLEPKLGWGVQRMDALQQVFDRVAESTDCHHAPALEGQTEPSFFQPALKRFYRRFASLSVKYRDTDPDVYTPPFVSFGDRNYFPIAEISPGLFQIAKIEADDIALCVTTVDIENRLVDVFVATQLEAGEASSHSCVLTNSLETLLLGLLSVVEDDRTLYDAFPNSFAIDTRQLDQISGRLNELS